MKKDRISIPNTQYKDRHYKISNGYIIVYAPEHPNIQRHPYIKLHRLIMEAHLGRLLKQEELVHHINGNKLDNRIKNLALTTRRIHPSYHTRDLHDRQCIECGSKTTSIVNKGKYIHKPYYRWHKHPNDKTKWCCNTCRVRLARKFVNQKSLATL